MDEELKLTLKTITGSSSTIIPKQSSTLRSLLTITTDLDIPSNSYPIFFHNGKTLNPDLSIARHRLQPNDTVIVMFRKNGATLDSKHDIENQSQNPDKHSYSMDKQQKELFQEALRVSDVAFILLESAKNATTIYRSLMESQDDTFSDDDDNGEDYPTVIENNNNYNYCNLLSDNEINGDFFYNNNNNNNNNKQLLYLNDENQQNYTPNTEQTARTDPLPICWSEDSENDTDMNDESDADIIEQLRDRCCSGTIVKPNCGNEW